VVVVSGCRRRRIGRRRGCGGSGSGSSGVVGGVFRVLVVVGNSWDF